MMRKLIKNIVYHLPYPHVGGLHFIVGTSLWCVLVAPTAWGLLCGLSFMLVLYLMRP